MSTSMSIMHMLSRDVRDLLLKSHHLSHSISWTVETVDHLGGDDALLVLEPLSFVREFVAPARPLLIRNAAPNEWQIQAQPNQLAASLKGAKVQVDIAGGGLADAVVRAPGPDAADEVPAGPDGGGPVHPRAPEEVREQVPRAPGHHAPRGLRRGCAR